MKTFLILAALTALAAPVAVQTARSATVRSADLDLANAAAKAACGAPLSRELGEVERVRSCKVQVMAGVLRRVDAGIAAALSQDAARTLAAR